MAEWVWAMPLRKHIPATNKTDEPKSTSNFQQVQNILLVRKSGGRSDAEVGGRDEGEQHDESEEDEEEESVDTNGRDHEHEANHAPKEQKSAKRVFLGGNGAGLTW